MSEGSAQARPAPRQVTGDRAAGPAPAPRRRLAGLARAVYVDLALLGALALLLVIFGVASGGKEFLGTNLINIVDSGSILGVVTVGEVVVMISGNLDISVGSAAGLVTAALAESMAHTGASLAVGLVIAVVTGAAAGALNAFAVAYARINSVIATLATFSAYLGLALLVTGGQQVGVSSSALGVLGTGKIGPVPYLVLILIGVAIVAIAAMRFSLAGHYVYAVGGGPEASRLSGIRVQRVIFSVFVVSGLCAAVAGVMLASQTGTAQPSEGQVGLELTAITAVLLGGTGLTGGTGTVLGAVLGVLVLETLDNGLLLLGIPAFWQEVATGGLLLVAVLLQDFGGHRSRLAALRAARRRARTRAEAARGAR